jgi:glycosyltransferase involved in cell wall biosynthesis
VVICLATYNGETYLRDQLESLINQENVDIEILVGDDGSTDKTLGVLREYAQLGKLAGVHHFNRVGTNKNFLNLLKLCKEYDFVAFSDQDDIWESNKLYELSKLLGSEKPELAFCQRSILISGKRSYIPKFLNVSKVGFQNALVENVAPGNTMLLNQKAVEIIIASNASSAEYYDSYIYLLISGLGVVKYLPKPLLKYRIHENNAVGIRRFDISGYKHAVKNYVFNAQLLKSGYSESLDAEKLELLENFLMSFQEKNKIKSVFRLLSVSTFRQSTLDDLIWRAIAILVSLRSDPT